MWRGSVRAWAWGVALRSPLLTLTTPAHWSSARKGATTTIKEVTAGRCRRCAMSTAAGMQPPAAESTAASAAAAAADAAAAPSLPAPTSSVRASFASLGSSAAEGSEGLALAQMLSDMDGPAEAPPTPHERQGREAAHMLAQQRNELRTGLGPANNIQHTLAESDKSASQASSSSSPPSPSSSSPSLSESVSSPADATSAVSISPCHPSSLLSLPLFNLLKGEVHSLAFVKMSMRASVAPPSTPQARTWAPVPQWDFADRLPVPASRSDPTWTAYQNAMADNQTVQLAEAAKRAQREVERAAATGDPAAAEAARLAAAAADVPPVAHTLEPFRSAQVSANIPDFLISPTLHQCRELVAAVEATQREFLSVHRRIESERLSVSQQGLSSADMHAQVKQWKSQLARAWVPRRAQVLVALVDAFVAFMDEPVNVAQPLPSAQDADHAEVQTFMMPDGQRGTAGSDATVQSHLLKNRAGRLRFDPTLAELANFSAPHEWYPLARSLPRKFIVHVGPTNSGKTYHAMQRLMAAKSGMYCGPLRLLAWEVKDKMNKAGVACSLLTGQEKEIVEGALHTSGTVEMASLDTIIDVAVVDEVQMLASVDRGASWTRALLGLPAYEIHVCGDTSMVEIVEELCAITGEPVEVREYQRLTPLVVTPPLAGGLKDIRRGDCIVAFSRMDLYRLKSDIEQQLGLKVCIIYGSLPPEARRQQAGLFNDPNSGYDVLVATDAIGMGLNLNISRVIFEKMSKFDGYAKRPLTPSETLQIAGRAGRFQTGASAGARVQSMEEAALSNRGEVTTLNPKEHAYLQWAMKQQLPPIQRAGLAPTFEQITLLHRLRPHETLTNLLTYFAQYAKLDSLYFTVDMEGMKDIADVISDIEFQSLRDRWTFCQAPANMNAPKVRDAMDIYARLFASGARVPANSVHIPNLKLEANQVNMLKMEVFYQVLDLYCWLGQRFGTAQFFDLDQATAVRATVARIVQRGIESLAPSDQWMRERQGAVARATRKQAQAHAHAHAKPRPLKPSSFSPREKDRPHKGYAKRKDK